MTSSYLQYLPVPLQQGDLQGNDREKGFLGRFLCTFECLLTGLEGRKDVEGIEQKLDRIHTWFEPENAPEDFLPWLASWVAVSLREDWTHTQKRQFIQRAVSLHRMRGTPQGLKELLEIFLDKVKVQIFETEDPQVHGEKKFPAHFFLVSFSVEKRDLEKLNSLEQRVRSLIEEQKPAHTFYGLEIKFPPMQISSVLGKQLRVGRNTILGTEKPKS